VQDLVLEEGWGKVWVMAKEMEGVQGAVTALDWV